MSDRRAELLRAAQEAAHVLHELPPDPGVTSFDVVRAVTEIGVPVLFRPLGGLLGAAISIGDDTGVLVTTNRDRHVQRFTLAHELGHILLGHKTKFDTDISFMGRFADGSRPIEEVAADTFASELLMPVSLARATAKRQQWTRAALHDPTVVYQFALRLGVSFKAACWGLVQHKVLGQVEAYQIQDTVVKRLKRALTREDYLTNPWADVWRLTAADDGTALDAGPDDIFTVELNDNASSGYLWDLVEPGVGVVLEEGEVEASSYGGLCSRVLTLRFPTAGRHRLQFVHRRPWSEATIGYIDVHISNYGKETVGLPRRVRLQMLEAP